LIGMHDHGAFKMPGGSFEQQQARMGGDHARSTTAAY